MEKKNFRPDKIMMYFQAEWKVLGVDHSVGIDL